MVRGCGRRGSPARRITVAHVSADNGMVTIAAGRNRKEVQAGHLLHPGIRPLPEADLVVDGGDPVFGGFLARMNAVPGIGPEARRDLRPVRDPSPDLVDAYRTVLRQLRECWPEAADELVRYVKVVVPFQSDLLLGWATPLFQGAVFVRAAPDDLLFTFERLVHEAAHLRLFAIQRTVGRLHNDPPDKRLASVARPDPRPVIGVYHAAFVYGRLVEAFARAISHGAGEHWSRRLEVLLGRYRSLSHTLHEQATLTALGADILVQLDERISGL